MKKALIICGVLLLVAGVLFVALSDVFSDPKVILTFSEGTTQAIEHDVALLAHFQPDNIMRNHGFDFYIKYYFKNDRLIACDHIYKFETEEKALKWRKKYSEALDETAGCYVDGTSVIKNELYPSFSGKSLETVLKTIEYNFNYIDSELIYSQG
ncbi:MAG: hypothetical protein IJF80_06075 [Clostridia bacterium]|nr:hypothetical protein [Clostridia bacterium]